MGEPQLVIAEPDELEEEADIDRLHPPTLHQHSPWFISIVVSKVISMIVSIGWYALAILLVGYILWWYLEPRIRQWLRKREISKEAAEYHKDPDKALARERAIDKARQRMQEMYNLQAQKQAKERELEEKNKEEEKEDLELHKQTKESRPKNRIAEGRLSSASGSNSTTKPSGKPRLRPEYNPLMGDSSGRTCGWRPSQRGSSGGG